MDCEQFQRTLHDLDRPGTAGSTMRESALAHAESCSSCALLLIESEALDYGLRCLSLQDAAKKAPRQLEAILLREFRGHHAGPRSRAVEWYAAVVGVAAMALLALGVARFHLGSLPTRPSRTATVASNRAASGSAVATQAPADPATKAPAATTSNDTGPVEFASSEQATDFFPLPYADDSALLDGGAVIRVAMPRSTLASWGFPVSGAAADRIPAELVVGADGTPQAIRLIAEMNETND